MASKNQVSLTLTDELAGLLDGIITRFGKRGRASVVTEILEIYLPLYEQLEAQRRESLDRQIEQALGKAPTVTTTRRKLG